MDVEGTVMSDEPLVFGDLRQAAKYRLCAKCGGGMHLSWNGAIFCDGCGRMENRCDCREVDEEAGDEFDY